MLKIQSRSDNSNDLGISEIEEKTVLLYFSTLNGGFYRTTASLFAEKGMLKPPFDNGIVGQENILNYLEKEAKGMRLIPGYTVKTPDGCQVTGTVQTALFSVNVMWSFAINSTGEIDSVEIKLLAKLEDLLSIKQRRTLDVAF